LDKPIIPISGYFPFNYGPSEHAKENCLNLIFEEFKQEETDGKLVGEGKIM